MPANSGRIASVDYGRRRVGIALSDPARKIATPLAVYARRDLVQDARYFQLLAREHDLVQWVVGLPVHTSGAEGPMAAEARQFGRWLLEVTRIPVIWWDERYSSVEAAEHLGQSGLSARRKRQLRDKVAAQVLLQAFLDRGPQAGEGGESLQDASQE